MEPIIEGNEYFVRLSSGQLASAPLYRCDVCQGWAYLNPAPLTEKECAENPGIKEIAEKQADEIGLIPEMPAVDEDSGKVACRNCCRTGTNRAKNDFERFIDHMVKRRSSKAKRLTMLKEMINEGSEFLSAEAQNYLIDTFNKIAGNDDKLPNKMPF